MFINSVLLNTWWYSNWSSDPNLIVTLLCCNICSYLCCSRQLTTTTRHISGKSDGPPEERPRASILPGGGMARFNQELTERWLSPCICGVTSKVTCRLRSRPSPRVVALNGFCGLYVDRIMTVLLGDILWASKSYFKMVYSIIQYLWVSKQKKH